MERATVTFGRRKGGYTTAELAAYRQSRSAAFDAQNGRTVPSAPISNEVQGLRGLAKVDQIREPEGSRRGFGRLLLLMALLMAPFFVATVGPSLLACGGRDRPLAVFVDHAVRACVGRGAKERLQSFQAHLLSRERSVGG